MVISCQAYDRHGSLLQNVSDCAASVGLAPDAGVFVACWWVECCVWDLRDLILPSSGRLNFLVTSYRTCPKQNHFLLSSFQKFKGQVPLKEVQVCVRASCSFFLTNLSLWRAGGCLRIRFLAPATCVCSLRASSMLTTFLLSLMKWKKYHTFTFCSLVKMSSRLMICSSCTHIRCDVVVTMFNLNLCQQYLKDPGKWSLV